MFRTSKFAEVGRSVALTTAIVAMVGCSAMEGPEFKSVSPETVLSFVEINEGAAMMQVGDTLDLTLIAKAVDNTEITLDTSHTVWSSEEPTIVSVTQEGRVIAHTASSVATNVSVEVRYGLVTRRTSIPITVTTDRIAATGSRLILLDSNKVGLSANAIFGLPRIRLDLYQGDVLTYRGVRTPMEAPEGVTLLYTTSADTAVGNHYQVRPGITMPYGPFWIKARVNLYGMQVSDSVQFIGGYATSAAIGLVPATGGAIAGNKSPFDPPAILQPCANMVISSALPQPVDIVFSDSAAGEEGCAPFPQVVTPAIRQIGGNMLNVARGVAVARKSSTRGEIRVWLRDAVTKDSLPYQIRFLQKDPE
jgi:hypothetical protein